MARLNERRIIGENIRRLREEEGLSVDDLLKRRRVEIARGYWYEIERGEVNVTIGNLVIIAKALGVSVRDLLDRDAARGVQV